MRYSSVRVVRFSGARSWYLAIVHAALAFASEHPDNDEILCLALDAPSEAARRLGLTAPTCSQDECRVASTKLRTADSTKILRGLSAREATAAIVRCVDRMDMPETVR